MKTAYCRVAVLGLSALVLTACTGEVMQSHVNYPGADTYFTSGASPGEMKAVIVGNPFPVPREELERAVTDALYGNHYGPVTRFTTDPGPRARENHRIVVAFNTPQSMHAGYLCDDPAQIGSGPSGERLRALVGFCVGGRLYSDALISIPAVGSPNDPRFAHMIASAMWELVPARDPFESDNASCLIPPC